MSDHSQTTNAPSEPVLCKMGCGFFGNAATGGCCSKCFRDQQKKESEENSVDVCCLTKKQQPSSVSDESMPDAQPEACDASMAPEENVSEEQQSTIPKKKKGKKKQSYKSMMAGMLNTQSSAAKAEKEMEALRKVTGGGAFSKIEKI